MTNYFYLRNNLVLNFNLFYSNFADVPKNNTYENNNSFYTTSTPKINGNINDNNLTTTDGRFRQTNGTGDDMSPIRNLAKEEYMNSVNANLTPNTTTIVADIEGEVKKRPRNEKTYYIAKELLMTEITYKKDLDVINVVSI